ncbi:hypothetical protein BGZ51_003164 [Haplosporangium sp. Z 767]|nr:hypothetical protein BGZ51_003164 [Haplosporangium sp. Z 767]
MPRLGRRGIILSLFINSLNITLYLIILIAACLNITEASVNFIILNAFAACFACLLIISEIRLPQLTYEYFRFLCTYRGRGMTYLFFGCLVASRIPFNLYGGIIVVCMGLAFIVLSYVTLIPPLDGFILNYKKLDQWKEQKHFRVQLEAQRIFEQQLQQEQSLTRMIPAHHTNTMTTHANMTLSSPKQIRGFPTLNTASIGAGTRNDAGVVPGTPNTLFSPPMSPPQRKGNGYQPSPMQSQQQHNDAQEPQSLRHQLQTNISTEQQKDLVHISQDESLTAGPSDTTSSISGNKDRIAIERGKGRVIQEQALLEESLTLSEQPTQQQPQRQLQHPLHLDKSLPKITRTQIEGTQPFTLPASFTLSPPPTRRKSAVQSGPGSPLQYLHMGKDDPSNAVDSFPAFDLGKKTECESDLEQTKGCSEPSETDTILKSAPDTSNVCADHYPQRRDHQQHQRHQQQQQKPGQDKFPLRTANKPAPPHDPFRRASISSNSANKSASVRGSNGQRYQSLYQPPEPKQSETIHPLHYPLHVHPHSYYYQEPPSGTLGLTATGRILSSIGGMSGCYGIASGVPKTLAAGNSMPTSWRHDSSSPPAHVHAHQNQDQEIQAQVQEVHHFSMQQQRQQQQQQHQHQPAITITENSCDPSMGSNHHQYQWPHSSKQQHKQYQQEIDGRAGVPHMPDIVLTLPTPAETETGQGSRREEYFAM